MEHWDSCRKLHRRILSVTDEKIWWREFNPRRWVMREGEERAQPKMACRAVWR